MLKILICFFIILMTYSLANADNNERYNKIAEMPEGIISGKVKDIYKSNNEGRSIIKLQTTYGIIYLEVIDAFIQIKEPSKKWHGKTIYKPVKKGVKYDFYPVTSADINVKTRNTTIPILYTSTGIINKGYSHQSRFNVLGLKMGEKLPDNIDSLKQTIVNNSPGATAELIGNTLKINDYKIGEKRFKIEIGLDYFKKIYAITFTEIDGVQDKEELDNNIIILCDMFKKKYNLENIDYAKIANSKKDNEYIYCSWEYAWLYVHTGYKEENGLNMVFGTIADATRAAQTYNIALSPLIDDLNKSKERLDKLIKEKHDMEINEGLKSF